MTTNDFKLYVLGLIKSWTAWVGAVLLTFPEWWPLVEPYFVGVVDPDIMARVVGVVMILLRIKTTESIKEKGRESEATSA